MYDLYPRTILISIDLLGLPAEIGIPPAPALVADSLTATSLRLEWKGIDIERRGGGISYLVQWRYEELAETWQYCRNQSWGEDDQILVENLQPYTKYRVSKSSVYSINSMYTLLYLFILSFRWITVSRSVTFKIVPAQSRAYRLRSKRRDTNAGGRFTNLSTGNCKSGGSRQLPRVCVLGTGPISKRATFVLCPASARGWSLPA